jgi:hypothetical protein
LRFFVAALIDRLDEVRRQLTGSEASPVEAIDRLLATLLAQPSAGIVAQFEAYLEAARRPEVRREVAQVIAALERLAQALLEAAGAERPATGARALVALIDGFALHRVAWPNRRGDRQALRRALVDLLAGQLLTEAERASRDARLVEVR